MRLNKLHLGVTLAMLAALAVDISLTLVFDQIHDRALDYRHYTTRVEMKGSEFREVELSATDTPDNDLGWMPVADVICVHSMHSEGLYSITSFRYNSTISINIRDAASTTSAKDVFRWYLVNGRNLNGVIFDSGLDGNGMASAQRAQIRWAGIIHDGWTAAIVCGLTWSFWRMWVRIRRERRKRLGLCGECGYPIEQSADYRCPECGNTAVNNRNGPQNGTAI